MINYHDTNNLAYWRGKTMPIVIENIKKMLLEGRRDDARSDEAGDVSHVRHEESARLEGRENFS